jgi:thiamine biosynthesis lipoprotein
LAIDLGGLGKGFALDEISQLYQEHSISNAFLDSGGSTFLAIGNESPEAEGWPATIGPYGVIALKNEALSASGFEVQGQHIVDPRTGAPVETDRQRTWVQTESAALADALSTATLVMSDDEIGEFCEAHPDVSVMMG